jgi:IS5 family transposase
MLSGTDLGWLEIDSKYLMRQFVGIDLGHEPVPDETTACKFRHLLEEHHLGEQILGTVNLHLQAQVSPASLQIEPINLGVADVVKS